MPKKLRKRTRQSAAQQEAGKLNGFELNISPEEIMSDLNFGVGSLGETAQIAQSNGVRAGGPMSRTETFARKSLPVGLASLSYVAPALAGRIATSLWFTPFPLSRPKPMRIPSGARSVEFESAGSVVHGYELGDGSHTALLIHGWAGSSRQYRRIAARLAEEGYRCVVIDLPAHGIEAGASTNLFEMADAIEVAGNALPFEPKPHLRASVAF